MLHDDNELLELHYLEKKVNPHLEESIRRVVLSNRFFGSNIEEIEVIVQEDLIQKIKILMTNDAVINRFLNMNSNRIKDLIYWYYYFDEG